MSAEMGAARLDQEFDHAMSKKCNWTFLVIKNSGDEK